MSDARPSQLSDPKRAFGLRLAQVRRSKHWSQERLALESGIARSYLSGVERGKRNIALENICRLAATLEVEAWQLLRFDQVKACTA